MEAPIRCGAKEKEPTLRVRRAAPLARPFEGSALVHGFRESTGYCLLRVRELAIRTGEPGLGGMILGDAGISGQEGQVRQPVRHLVLVSGSDGTRSVTTSLMREKPVAWLTFGHHGAFKGWEFWGGLSWSVVLP